MTPGLGSERDSPSRRAQAWCRRYDERHPRPPRKTNEAEIPQPQGLAITVPQVPRYVPVTFGSAESLGSLS